MLRLSIASVGLVTKNLKDKERDNFTIPLWQRHCKILKLSFTALLPFVPSVCHNFTRSLSPSRLVIPYQ
ncbi:hypothetical protein XELAEV_18033464mg [Xenopus laevis]|uniref:Uncharacterized protein n=1 Tax=Xenopus laevis TaxID=8355 RepID=A0A974CJD3_XENLA|nr:hypothetical protein XELAEV_18033464mg [Xenopus laevis]